MLWALVDHRIGNSKQTQALAEALAMPYELKHISYTNWTWLPPFLLKKQGLHLSDLTKSRLAQTPLPHYIVSVGKRLGLAALYVQFQHPNIKLIHLMRPPTDLQRFSLIISPEHDNFVSPYGNNITIKGSLHNVTPCAKKNLISLRPQQDFIGVLLGGDSTHYRFSQTAMANLMKIPIALSLQNNLYISFSNRTPAKLKSLILAKFLNNQNVFIYDPRACKANQPNPYLAILHQAQCLVLTGDSISMCSEAVSTGKPTYIYWPEDFKDGKHKVFCDDLVKIQVARYLTKPQAFLKDYQYQPLNEMQKVVRYIKLHLLK